MSGLWGDDDVETPENGEFSAGGGDFDVIPAKTRVVFMIEQIAIEQPNQFVDAEYINIRWSILLPEIYVNRKIFQKIQVFATDKEKRKKARQMLAAIDFNSDSRMTKFAEKKNKTLEEFTSDDLATCLVGRTMSGVLQVWKDNDTKEQKGNWVQSIAPANAGKQSAQSSKQTSSKAADNDDDDIPF